MTYIFLWICGSSLAGKSGIEGEKKFAIIIGFLAGVAILVIFLAFLSKVCCRPQGKYIVSNIIHFLFLWFFISLFCTEKETLKT